MDKLGRALLATAPALVGTTPSYPEALEWAEQARMDGWQHVGVDAAEAGAGAA